MPFRPVCSWVFPVCPEKLSFSSFKGCSESPTLPLISLRDSALKIKPVSQIISWANQQSLCIRGWKEKLVKTEKEQHGKLHREQVTFSPPPFVFHIQPESSQRPSSNPANRYLGILLPTTSHPDKSSPHGARPGRQSVRTQHGARL